MPNNYDKLLNLLRELFQLDQAKELDFGIYRIIAQREKEITDFMEKDLLPQVKDILGETASGDNAAIQAEIDKAVQQAKELGVEPEGLPKVKELKAKLGEGGDLAALENEVFSHLYSFFRRYYHQGDFISQRRYKEGVYAIPYEGEEVKLHWANADQYYIKTTENFRDFTFKLPSKKRVHFKLVEAITEQDNKKVQEGKDRRFKLYEEQPLMVESEELVIRFVYKVDKTAQKKLTEAAVEAILAAAEADFKPWARELSTKAPTEKNRNRNILEKHLTQYTAKNTFDYFIHKDLMGFLKREMDFYIKNEMMHLDDIENESAPNVESYLSKVKAFRKIASQIITFLAQLEDFQRKLWLKKKFVVETNWCITLDHVLAIEDAKTRAKLLEEIAANAAQWGEWVNLFAVDEVAKNQTERSKKQPSKGTGSLFQSDEGFGQGKSTVSADSSNVHYSGPRPIGFFEANHNLVIDTAFFSNSFKVTLLSMLSNLEDSCNGLLVNGDNAQALGLMSMKYSGKIKCIYIDPPYNTGKDGFVYKDNYMDSCWLSFIYNRLLQCREFLAEDGCLFCSIDDNEAYNLEILANSVFGSEQLLVPFFIQVRYANKTLSEDNDFQRTIERVLFYAKNGRTFKPKKDTVDYPFEKFKWDIIEKAAGTPFTAGGKQCYVFKPGEYSIEAVEPSLKGLKETWATGSLLRQKGSSGEFFGLHLALRKGTDGLSCLYKVEGIGEDGLGFRYFTGPQRESATKGKFYSGIPLQTLDQIEKGNAKKEVPIHNYYDFAADFGNCRHEGKVDISGGKKPEKLIGRLIDFANVDDEQDLVMDPFAGSGTTPSVAHKLGKKYLAVEQGEYFRSKVLVRMKRTLYGDTGGIAERPSGIIKYIRIESYEDCLNNLQLTRTSAHNQAFEFGDEKVKREYMLSYMLNVESRGSLLNLKAFEEPDEYVLNIQQGDETIPTKVDLPETFNYLLGLRVKHVDVIRGVRVIEGLNPTGERVLVLWRKAKKMDSDKLDEWFKKQGYNTKDMEYNLIYVNGDNNLENLRKDEHTWKVRLIEQEFHRLMFDVEDV